MTTVSITIVTYKPNTLVLSQCLKSIYKAIEYQQQISSVPAVNFTLIDNSTDSHTFAQVKLIVDEACIKPICTSQFLATQKNLGFGLAHNLAIMETGADYHLVLNPDVLLEKDALHNALEFMEAHPDVALLTPSAVNEHGEKEYLNKRYPGFLTLLVRGFAPAPLKKRFVDRIAHYEMRDLDPDEVHDDIPLASGCFMLFRTPVLKELGGFSDKFFLYFEDYDLSIRTRELGRIAYVPAVKITHFGGGAAKKGLKHIYLFIRSAITFFRLHGWKWW